MSEVHRKARTTNHERTDHGRIMGGHADLSMNREGANEICVRRRFLDEPDHPRVVHFGTGSRWSDRAAGHDRIDPEVGF
jgi:hypothetical protein